MPNRVFIVEDHEDMRVMYRRMLGRSGMEVCGEADSGEDALRRIPGTDANVILIDISLPGMDGIELVRRLREERSKACLMICTGHEVAQYQRIAFAAGADAITSKDDSRVLLRTLSSLMDGGCP